VDSPYLLYPRAAPSDPRVQNVARSYEGRECPARAPREAVSHRPGADGVIMGLALEVLVPPEWLPWHQPSR
jgi:hypothetical protein